MQLIKNRIKKAFNKNELICICLKTIDWNRRIIGYVKHIFEDNKFELEIIDEFGQKKSTKIFLCSSIKSLEVGGIYNENLGKLNKKGFLKNEHKPKYYFVKKNSLHKKLNQLLIQGTLCTFFFNTEFSIGIVQAVTETEFSIGNIAYDGTDDGISIFDVFLLTKIRYDSNNEIRISFLMK